MKLDIITFYQGGDEDNKFTVKIEDLNTADLKKAIKFFESLKVLEDE